MRREVRNTARAEADLLGIWEYTFEEWGVAQADRYLDELEYSIEQLVDNPDMGEQRDYVRGGYRVLLVNSHAVYYTVTDVAIRIVRVLHGQMDPGRHL